MKELELSNQPNVGDKVIIRGTIECVGINTLQIMTENGKSLLLYKHQITEIIPKPWAPEVGKPALAGQLCRLVKVLAVAEEHAMFRYVGEQSVGALPFDCMSEPGAA